MMNNPLDPNGLIAPLQQSTGAQLAGYNTAIQNAVAKSMMASTRTPDMQAALSYPSAPSLQFDADPGFSQGVGNGISNFYALKNYRSRTEMLNNAVLEQREKEKQQQDMLAATASANQERRKTGRGLLKPEEQSFYDVLSPDEQDKLLIKRATGKADVAMAPDQGNAEAQKKLAEYDALTEAIRKIGPLETRNPQGEMVPNPVAIRAYSELLNKTPYLTLDANKDFIGVKKANVDLKEAENNLGAQPGQLKRAALSETLANSKAAVDAKYAEALKLADKLTAENKLQEADDLKGRLAEGRPLYEDALNKYDTLTPGQIKLMNSKFKALSLPYELPEKKDNKMTPIKYKGKVTGFTDASGHVYDADGNPKG